MPPRPSRRTSSSPRPSGIEARLGGTSSPVELRRRLWRRLWQRLPGRRPAKLARLALGGNLHRPVDRVTVGEDPVIVGASLAPDDGEPDRLAIESDLAGGDRAEAIELLACGELRTDPFDLEEVLMGRAGRVF